mmetsp:Transcript_19516/g.40433  ORF Transcript_19516/g.40433 Transcript_19516/m.40433 type:complete len:201 (+) Transcript_19516:79-681(+)
MPLPSLSPRGANVSQTVVLPVQTILKPQQLVVLARKAPDQTSKLDLRDPQGDREMDQEGVLSLVLVDRHYGHTKALCLLPQADEAAHCLGLRQGQGYGVEGLLLLRPDDVFVRRDALVADDLQEHPLAPSYVLREGARLVVRLLDPFDLALNLFLQRDDAARILLLKGVLQADDGIVHEPVVVIVNHLPRILEDLDGLLS